MTRWLLILATIAFCASCAAPVAQQPETRLDRLIKQFEAVAFSSEFAARRNKFDRWEGDPAAIRLANGHQHRALVRRVADELAELSGLDIAIVGPNRTANVLITFGDFDQCFMQIDGPGEPARVRISTHALESCAYEEILQALALSDDACHVPSVLCNGTKYKRYTPDDRILIRTAFDKRLANGMTREEARPIVKRIIAELLAAK